MMWHVLRRCLPALCLLAPATGFADHDFEYKNVIACGPKIVTNLPSGYAGRNYIVMLDNEEGDQFSIVSNGYEYSSFKRMHYSELYVQRGGERWLEFKMLGDNSIAFELHDNQVRYRHYVTYITFDKGGLTADLTYNWKDEPLSLVCWDYEKGS